MGDYKCKYEKNKILQTFFKDFFAIPLFSIQFTLISCITFNPVFNLAENHFHKNCLRTSPAAKYSTKHNCKENYENYY